MNTADLTDVLTVENKALLAIANIMVAQAKAHRAKELAMLAKSRRAYEHFLTTLDTLVGLVGTKTLKEKSVKDLVNIRQGLKSLEASQDPVENKTDALRSILEDVEAIIRKHGWHDMPRFGGGSSMSLVEEFYGGDQKHGKKTKT